jgi:hypothetical protein
LRQPATSLISVQSFEYVWEKATAQNDENTPIIIPEQDEVKHSIEKSFAQAIKQRWNADVPTIKLSVKPLSLFSFTGSPKFNTKHRRSYKRGN